MIIKQTLRIVTYFDHQLVVPTWTGWVAIDADGSVYAFEAKPTPSYFEDIFEVCGQFQCIGEAEMEGVGWRETLLEIRKSAY